MRAVWKRGRGRLPEQLALRAEAQAKLDGVDERKYQLALRAGWKSGYGICQGMWLTEMLGTGTVEPRRGLKRTGARNRRKG